jgi:hypothetical protein
VGIEEGDSFLGWFKMVRPGVLAIAGALFSLGGLGVPPLAHSGRAPGMALSTAYSATSSCSF